MPGQVLKPGIRSFPARIAQFPATDQMQVYVVNLLAAIAVAVENGAISTLGDALFFCQIAGDQKHVAQQRCVVLTNVIDCGYWLASHYCQRVGAC